MPVLDQASRIFIGKRVQIMDALRAKGIQIDEGLYSYFKNVLASSASELH